jgi:hypothetical protein
MNNPNFLNNRIIDVISQYNMLFTQELNILHNSYLPNQKASIITSRLARFCKIIENVLYINLRNNVTITIRENIYNIIYYITSYLIENSSINNDFDARVIINKLHIEEYLPNIIGNLQYIEIVEPPQIPVVVRPVVVIPVVVIPEVVRNIIVFDEENARECSICLENKYRFNQTNCNHLFCTDCFPNIRNNSCPLCRANIYA